MSLCEIDLAILGGGCAGLSLAKFLSLKSQWRSSTVIIEPRTHYVNDRSWCFWESPEDFFQSEIAPLVSHRWSQWSFSSSEFHQVHRVANTHYCYLSALDFYKDALNKIQSHPSIKLMNGCAALSVKPYKNKFLIDLSDNTTLIAKQVIDTRQPDYTQKEQSHLWQIFYGLEIQTTEPIFDLSILGLMDNLQGVPGATQFLYTLPFSTTHALIELTHFTPYFYSPNKLKNTLLNQIKTDKFDILREEQAYLPLGLRSISKSSYENYSYAGSISGAIRPATGYAFLRIQRWAYQSSEKLSQGLSLSSPKYESTMVKNMDDIFIRVLKDKPEIGAVLFEKLAKLVPPCSLVRFLSQEAKLKDYLYIIFALPFIRFLIYALRLNYFFYASKISP